MSEGPRSRPSRRRLRIDLLTRSALYGVLAGGLGAPALAAPVVLPVQNTASTPQVSAGGAQPNITYNGAALTVQTGAPRTIIDWNSFTVGQGATVNFTFNNRSDIALNRMLTTTPVAIDGALTSTVNGAYGGNVWFSAPGGVLFGSTAVVNVGGLVATTGVLNAAGVTNFLDPSQTSFSFAFPSSGYPGAAGYPAGVNENYVNGTYYPSSNTYAAGSAYAPIGGSPTTNTAANGVGGVTVGAQASITTNGGLLALLAPFVNVASGAAVTAKDAGAQGGGAGSVLYGAANAYTLTLQQETSGDLDMLQFVIDSPSTVADHPLMLEGTTQGANVFAAALTAQGIAGAVVDATGTLTATRASAGEGGEIILSTGADTLNAPTDTSGFAPGSATAMAGSSYPAMDLQIGNLSADADIQLLSSGGIAATVSGSQLTSGAAMTLTAMGGGISLDNAATASGALTATASTVQTNDFGGTYTTGTGAFTVASLTAGGAVALSASSVFVGSIDVTSTAGDVVASSYDTAANPGGGAAFVDIGSIRAPGAITLTANDGYASLGSVTFTGTGQILTLNAYGYGGPAYLGYGPGGPSANGGAGPAANQGSVTGGGTIDIASSSDVDVALNGAAVLDFVDANGVVNVAADSVTLGSAMGDQGVNVTARTGGLVVTALNTNGSQVGLDATDGDVNANAALGDATIAEATGQNVYVTAAQTAHVDRAASTDQVNDPIEVKGADAYLGVADSQDDIEVTATNGSATVGDVTAAGSVTVNATGGSASLRSATLGAAANAGETGYPGETSYPNVVTLSASGAAADATLGGPDSLGNLGFVAGASAIKVSAGRDAAVEVSQPIELSTISAGRNLSITAPGLTLDSDPAGALAGNILIDVTGDAFTHTDALTAGRAITVEVSGALTLGDVTAQGGGVSLAGAGVTVGTVQAAGPISAQAIGTGPYGETVGTGPVSVVSASTTSGPIDLTGSSVAVLEALTASGPGGAVTALAYDPTDPGGSNTATVDIGSIAATGDILLTAHDGYASLSAVDFLGSGQTLTIGAYGSEPAYLGYGPGGPAANNGAGPTPNQGSVSGTGTIDISSYGDADVALNGAAVLDFVDASGVADITADSVTLGSAVGLQGVDVTARTGDLTVTALNTTGAQVGLDAAAGDVNAESILGDATIANVTGQNVYVTAAQTAHVDNATSTEQVSDPIDVKGASAYLGMANSRDDINVVATNGSATVGDVNAAGSVTVSATGGAASLHSAALGSAANDGAGYASGSSYPNIVTLSANGTTADATLGGLDANDNLGFVAGASAIHISAGRDAAVDVSQAIELSSISAGRNLSIIAPSLTLDAAPAGALAGDILIDVTAGDFTYTDAITVGGAATLEASGALTLGNVAAQGGGVSLLAATSIRSDNLAAAGPITAYTTAASATGDVAYAVDIGSAGSSGGGNIILGAAQGYASLGAASLTGAGVLSISAPNGDVYLGYQPGGRMQGGGGQLSMTAPGELSAGGGVYVDVTGAAMFDRVIAGEVVDLTADSIAANDVESHGGATLTADVGGLDLGGVNVSSAGATTLDAPNGAITVSQAVGGGAVTVTGGGAVSIASIDGAPGAGPGYTDRDEVSVTGGSVAVGAASPYGDLTLTAIDGPASLGFSSGAGSVTVSAINGAATVGGAALAPGGRAGATLDVSAMGAGGDVVLGSGSSVAVSGFAAVNLSGARDVTVDVGQPITLSELSVGRNLAITAPELTLNSSPTGALAGDVLIEVTAAGLTDSHALNAGGSISVEATGALSLGQVSSTGGSIALTGASVATGALSAPGDIFAADAAAGPTAAGAPAFVDVASATSTGGRAITVEAAMGYASLGSSSTTGAITVQASDGNVYVGYAPGGASSGGSSGTLSGGSVALGASGDVKLDVAGAASLTSVSAGGAASLTAVGLTAGAVTAVGAATLSAGSGDVVVASLSVGGAATLTGADVTLAGASVGGDLQVLAPGAASLGLGGGITGGGALTADAGGVVSIGSVAFAGASRVTAAGLDIATLLSAPTLVVESRNGAVALGGSVAPIGGGMWISAAEFAKLKASTALDLYAGAAETTSRGDLEISNLSLDPTMTPVVNLYAAQGRTVRVDGSVTPMRSGGALTVGSASDAAWTPSTILLTGALGAATRTGDRNFTGVSAFSQVSLNAGGDILIGSPRFIALIQATPANAIDIALNQPAGVAPTGSEVGEVFVAAGQLSLSAAGKVVQQNTAANSGGYAGLYLLNGVTTSRNALTLDPPSVVDLFGSYVDASGALQSGSGASRGSGLAVLGLTPGGAVPADYRFNGCEISPDAACGVDVGSVQGVQFLQEQQAAAVAEQTTAPGELTQPVLLTIAPSLQVDDTVDPLATGVGNEEIWRRCEPGGERATTACPQGAVGSEP